MFEVVNGVNERRNLRDTTTYTGLATFLCSQLIFSPSLLYCPHEPNSDALKVEADGSSKTPEETFHIMGVQPLLLQRTTTPVAVGWFAGRTWKNTIKWYI
jgi:hypothetical protein